MKLNEQNEIEYFKVDENEEFICDDDEEIEEEEVEMEVEEEEELIENPDGTMTIKMPEKKKKVKIIPVHHICAKCSKVLSSSAVSKPSDLIRFQALTFRSILGFETAFEFMQKSAKNCHQRDE